jgi:RAD51-like protein 1
MQQEARTPGICKTRIIACTRRDAPALSGEDGGRRSRRSKQARYHLGMSTRSLKRMGLGQEAVHRLEKGGLHTASDILTTPDTLLMAVLDQGLEGVRKVKDQVCEKICVESLTAEELLKDLEGRPSKIATGLMTLDRALLGGVPVGMITELVGPSGAGKTQFCLMLAAQCVLPPKFGGFGEGCGVIYINTDQSFSTERLIEIAQSRIPKYYDAADPEGGEIATANLTRLVRGTTVIEANTCEELLSQLQEMQSLVIEKKKRLLILDSAASLLRKEFKSGKVSAELSHSSSAACSKRAPQESGRQNALVDVAAILKHTADVLNMAVVVTNQTRRLTSRGSLAEGTGGHQWHRNDEAPSLGVTWHHCVSNRVSQCIYFQVMTPDANLILPSQIFMTFPHGEDESIRRAYGSLSLQKSPYAPNVSCAYAIERSGPEEVKGHTHF